MISFFERKQKMVFSVKLMYKSLQPRSSLVFSMIDGLEIRCAAEDFNSRSASEKGNSPC